MALAPSFINQETKHKVQIGYWMSSVPNPLWISTWNSEAVTQYCISVFYKNKGFFPHYSLLLQILKTFYLPVPWNDSIQHGEYKVEQLKLKSAFNSDPDFHSHFGWVQLHPDWNRECFPSYGFECASWLHNRRRLGGHCHLEVSPAGKPVTQDGNDIMQCRCSLNQPVWSKNLTKFSSLFI